MSGLGRGARGLAVAAAGFFAAAAAQASEFSVVADSFTAANQVNASSVTYLGAKTTAPGAPDTATQLPTPGGLYFDGSNYKVWERSLGQWVSVSTGTPSDPTRVLKAGDFMTGQLTTESTITVKGSSFSVGGSVLVVEGSNVGIGTPAPASKLDVEGNAQFGSGATKSTFSATGALTMASGAAITGNVTGSASLNVLKAGDTMTGQLTLAGSTLTVTGNAFSVGGSTLVVANGNLGIGTVSPLQPLQINTINGNLGFGSSLGGATNLGLYISPSAVGNLESAGGASNLAFRTAGAERVRIDSAGNVGIGTMTPQGLLHVGAGATPGLLVNSGGNVGIGTTGPTSRLQVGDDTVSTANQIVLGKYEAAAEGNLPLIQQKSVVNAGNGNDLVLGAQSTSGGIGFYTGLTGTANQLGTGSNAVRMVVTSGGNVGVSTMIPQTKLDVVGDAQFGTGVLKSTFTAAPGPAVYALRLSSGLAMAAGGPLDLTAGGFIRFGDGTTLAGAGGVTDASKVAKAGDTMTGPLTIAGASATVRGGLLAVGHNTAGVTESGAGYRFMWVPSSGAFRAGYVGGTQWDASSIGAFSSAAGRNNTASGFASHVGGGDDNIASGADSHVGGGFSNIASGVNSAIGGGSGNTASGSRSHVGGGFSNTASGTDSYVGGGAVNTASGGDSYVGGGFTNTASGASSTVPGGENNTAAGAYSLAAGLQAKATAKGSFVWADSTGGTLTNNTTDQFLVRSQGGFQVDSSSVNFVKGGVSRLYVDADGNVGVGTTSPATLLDVNGQAQFGPGPAKSTFSANGLTFPAAYIPTVPQQAATKGYVDGQVTGGSGWTKTGTVVALTSAADNAVVQSTLTVQGNAFSVGSSTFVVIGGNVGVSTGSPQSRLDVAGDAQFGTGVFKSTFTAAPGPAVYALRLSSGLTVAAGGPLELTTGGFIRFGDGTTLAGAGGVTDASKVAKAGDTMTGPLTIAGASATVRGGLLAVGYSPAGVTESGAGYRFMWVPSSGAFRAGFVDGNQWDASNIGAFSSAAGRNNTASGFGSHVGGGDSNQASALYSTVGGGVGNIASAQHTSNGGGSNNAATGLVSTVGGGQLNSATALNATVGGGVSNVAGGQGSTVPGGDSNTAAGDWSLAAGLQAKATAKGSFVWADSKGTPLTNTTTDQFLVRSQGGFQVDASSVNFVKGGVSRLYVDAGGNVGVSTMIPQTKLDVAGDAQFGTGVFKSTFTAAPGPAVYALRLSSGLTVAAGGPLDLTAGGFIRFGDGTTLAGAGGVTDASKVAKAGDTMTGPLTIAGASATVRGGLLAVGYSPAGVTESGAGYRFMWVPSSGAFRAGFVDGAQWDAASIGAYSSAAGFKNTASGFASYVGGGESNQATGSHSAVGGGLTNIASFQRATIAGGGSNTASASFATVGGGLNNKASNQYATVPGGDTNTAAGDYSMAAGRQAKATAQGSFVWADSKGTPLTNTTTDQFLVRSQGGFQVDASSVNFVKGGVSRLYVDAGGNVGVSTGSPQAQLHIQGLSAATTVQIIQRGGVGATGGSLTEWRNESGLPMSAVDRNGRLVFGNDVALSGAGISMVTADTDALGLIVRGVTGQTADLQRWQGAGGTNLAVVTAGGKFGLGTGTPTQQLHLTDNVLLSTANSNLNGNLFFSGDTTLGNNGMRLGHLDTFGGFMDVRASLSTSGLIFRTDTNDGGTERMRITAGGNVGIGTTVPATTLDVNGNAQFGTGAAKSTFTATGALVLAADPAAALQAATKQYVDSWTRPCVNPGDAGDIMVPVGDLCVDKYETSAWSTATGGTQYGVNGAADYPCGNGTTGTGQTCAAAGTKIFARSAVGVKPSTNLTWCQANIACANAGKHLLTNAEWQAAAAGTADPGALAQDAGPACNTNGTQSMTTGNGTSCLSSYGVENMIGSVAEWVADWGQYGQISQAIYVAWTDGTLTTTLWPGAGYNADGSWNVAGRSSNGSASVSGMPGAVIRGGGWGGGARAGVFAFDASLGPSSWGSNVGFRCGRRR